jgi:hypothetical protein
LACQNEDRRRHCRSSAVFFLGTTRTRSDMASFSVVPVVSCGTISTMLLTKDGTQTVLVKIKHLDTSPGP